MTKRDHQDQAALFLQEVYRRANHYADRIDPKRLRQYSDDPILKALDAITGAASHALYCFKPDLMTKVDE